MESNGFASRLELVSIAKKVLSDNRVSPREIHLLCSFQQTGEIPTYLKVLSTVALPLSILTGALFAMYPDYFDVLFQQLPWWTNLSPEFLAGFDYMWTIIGEPVGKPNLFFHLQNIVLYSFGILGIKSIIYSIHYKSWINLVLEGQMTVKQKLDQGTLEYSLQPGFSIVFIGKGDFIGMQFVLNHPKNQTLTLSKNSVKYTNVWNKYQNDDHFDNFNTIMERSYAKEAGEYILFPVQDDQIFLPSETAYDIPPYQLDLLCQDIRMIEIEHGWEHKPIIIVGDRFHHSDVRSEDDSSSIEESEEHISLEQIAQRHKKIVIVDPTDLVLQKIIQEAGNKKIVFRGTPEGLAEYKSRFYSRLQDLGYKQPKNPEGTFIIGYDLYEDQIEQQSLCSKLDNYYPIVLSKTTYDSLTRNKIPKSRYLYVPDLVLSELKRLAKDNHKN